ncbi:hypothetical protein H6P81_007892 [Aristolochia fimbriata]|uniref:guanylate kinase n=1 Tax=Aristolochia fimbriata TaxID=158543 RepID=A0AAV7F1Q9_ARIFI|nr:hypothetical protein H6P81_007892 [Aristolochia fimbriata]
MWLLYFLFMLWVELALSKSDSDALLDFKKGIQADPSGHIMSSWDGNSLESDQCPANWYGIVCIKGHVVSITLNDLGMTGSVDFSALTHLKTLRNLSISNNNVMGVLPRELGSVGSLEFLDLSGNLFHGSIPVDLVNLENLVYLNLSSNKLSGPMPSTFGKLLKLKYFDLHSNDLSGNLGSVLNQLPSLVYLDLSSNVFSGSLNLGFSNSTFVESIQYLNVSHNGLVGELFGDSEMPLFDNLEIFDASYNQLVGQIPPFNFVVSLQILQLGNNKFSGSLPEAFLHESSLVLSELDISCNQLQGPVGSITSTTLKRLNLSSNTLSGSLPLKIGHVAVVDLSHNLLSGNLSAIRNWGNYIEVINLSSNSLSGTLPNETSQFLRLTTIDVSNNSLQGVLPLVIGTYPELSVIDLSLNQLSGSLPPTLFASLRLTYLNLSHNQLFGSNPLPISTQGESLEFLDLSDNLFSGTVDPKINSMDMLKLLNLRRNNVSGRIPREIGELDNLVYLDLSNNIFEGPIPGDFPSGLEYLNVSYNNLSGTVPDNLLRFPESSFHPGNSLLVFPPGALKNGSGIMLGSQKGMKSRKAALIAACIGGAAFVACFMIMVYYWTRGRVCNGREVFGRNIENKDTREGRSLPHLFGMHKGPKPPAASSSFSQDQLLSSKSRSAPEQAHITVGPAESMAKADFSARSPTTGTFPQEAPGKTSVASFSTSAPHSAGQHLPNHPVVLDVCSPDRLAGDLHIFDNTFQFTAEELSGAPAEVIGRSCHGTTYRATLGSGRVLTVKWLREGITKSKKEFAREAKKLGNIRHQNIISLRGYYWGQREHERLIISDYVHAKSLNVHLFGAEPSEFRPLSSTQRLEVAIEIARGLSYLHNERAIPHGNLKSANILLEGPELNTYLADYSLHRLLNPAGTAEQVLNSGALGYCPPEFASTSKPCPSLKSDIYAFGVILLEILTGKCAGEIVTGIPGVVDLTDWGAEALLTPADTNKLLTIHSFVPIQCDSWDCPSESHGNRSPCLHLIIVFEKAHSSMSMLIRQFFTSSRLELLSVSRKISPRLANSPNSALVNQLRFQKKIFRPPFMASACLTNDAKTDPTDPSSCDSADKINLLRRLETVLGSPFRTDPLAPPPNPLVIVISGPSGVGKDAVIERLREVREGIHFVVTATSRAKRPGEVEGKDYFFVTKEKFLAMIERNELLEYALVYGDYKGVPKEQIRDFMSKGYDIVLRVDIQGAATLRSVLGDSAAFIFLVAESEEALVKRLVERKTETTEALVVRIATAREEVKHLKDFDYVVVNSQGKLENAVQMVASIIDAEKARVRQRQVRI